MASLKQLATEYIDALGKPFDHLLYERIKALIIHERSTEIRRSVQKYGLDEEFLQRYKITLVPVDASDLYGVNSYHKVFRSENKIATLIRVPSDSPFSYVGAVDLTVPFLYIQPYALGNIDSLPALKDINKYSTRNGYVYVYTKNVNLKELVVEAPFVNPHLIDNSNYTDASIPFTDDMEFFISEDMIQNIKIKLLKGELSVTNTSDKEVNIEEDENAR